ncbi:hypothetical protein JHK87_033275 [Glycine soja]|nr:hypothetical protein JHK87_033275 [Glycine soja]
MDNARKVGIFMCILILIMDVIAGILGLQADIAQHKVKHLKLWILESRRASHQAYMLGLSAAVFLGIAHLIVNLLRYLPCNIVLLIRILCGVGLCTLAMGTIANKSSKDLSGLSDNHLLKVGGICCFSHCILYYVTHITF